MEQVIIKAVQLFLSLSILVIIHELGHFMFARLFRVRVEKFYLFFNPWFTLFKIKKGQTEYGVGWLPLGGYVKISGMIDESMDRESMQQPPQPWEFRSKGTFPRLLIMIGGALMNFILAMIIYVGILFTWGSEYLSNASVKHGITVDETGEKIGLRNGDIILSVNNQPIEEFHRIMATVLLEDSPSIQVLREGHTVNVDITNEDKALLIKAYRPISPRMPLKVVVTSVNEGSSAQTAGLMVDDIITDVDGKGLAFYDQFSHHLLASKNQEVVINVLRNNENVNIPVMVNDEGKIGITHVFSRDVIDFLKYERRSYSFLKAIPAGINLGISNFGDYLKQLKLIFSPKTKAYESLVGFIGIGNIFPGQWDWHSFWLMTAFLSIVLGIINLLPIPALDGGHVMFLLFEMITGRKPGEKFLEYAQITGIVIILLLVLYANINDVVKIFN